MGIDFEAVTRALREIGYAGYFTLECDQAVQGCTADNVADKVQLMADTARRLTRMFEQP